MATDVPHRAVRRTAMEHRLAMRLAAAEYRRVVELLAGLSERDWTRPTSCPDWDVRQLVCHIVGMARMAAGPLEAARQQKLAMAAAQRDGIEYIDALTGLQVNERTDRKPADLVSALRALGPRAARARRFTPYLIRRRTMPVSQLIDGVREDWTLGYLLDIILTRDPWMHRSDLALATERPMELTADHDGVIVADVVSEWASRHGRPYQLTLTGPAGGIWSHGTNGESLELDAVEFCRTLSGRGPGSVPLATHVPF
ncbi:maleylpyruvate isomerase family mycothiol-dependent enzyme [Kribbella sp. NPDC055110]